MTTSPIPGLAAQLGAAAPAGCSRGALTELVSTSLRLRSALDAFDAELAIRAVELEAAGVGDVPIRVLASDGRRSESDAKLILGRGDVCVAMPDWHAALSSGVVTAGHTDSLARLHGELDDAGRAELIARSATLIASASARPVAEFTREMRKLARILAGDEGKGQAERMRQQRSLRRWTDRQTGMCHTHLVLDPEADARLSLALDEAVRAEKAKPETEQRTLDQLRADAMLNLVSSPGSGPSRPGAVMVLIDHDTIANGPHVNTVCETVDGNELSPEAVRRTACDAEIIPVVLNGQGVVLDVGRGRRVATAAQRNALRAMYRTCGHPGCMVRFADCEIHHVKPWNEYGPTDMANLLPLCSRHHHLVHEGGWELNLQPDRTITLTRPNGSEAFVGSTVNVAPTSVLEHGPPARAPAA